MSNLDKPFEFHSFSGTFSDIGQQYGEVCREDIKKHIDLAINYLSNKSDEANDENLRKIALDYQKYVVKYTPFFDELIIGLSKGARIELWEAYLLQLRAEVNKKIDSYSHECTTFTVLSEKNYEENIIAQNVDLPDYYKKMFKVIEYIPDGFPRILMLAPVGQISHIGINEFGLGVAGNFIATSGWKEGLPRYLFSGLALTKNNITDVRNSLNSIERASSRNLMVLQGSEAINLEILPSTIGELYPEKNVIVHTNHIVNDTLKSFEMKKGEDLLNSNIRREKAEKLIYENIKNFDITKAQSVLKDRSDEPHSICRLSQDFGEGKTVASFISQPSKGEIWVSSGPPTLNKYFKYTFTK